MTPACGVFVQSVVLCVEISPPMTKTYRQLFKGAPCAVIGREAHIFHWRIYTDRNVGHRAHDLFYYAMT